MSTLQTFIQQALLKTITVPFSVLAFIFSPVFVLLKGIWLLVTGILYAPIALALKFETVYIYLGSALLLGLLTGTIVALLSYTLSSLLAMPSPPKPTRTPKTRSLLATPHLSDTESSYAPSEADSLRLESEASSIVEFRDTFNTSIIRTGLGSGTTSGYYAIGTILEEEEGEGKVWQGLSVESSDDEIRRRRMRRRLDSGTSMGEEEADLWT
ncbi:hypothetical protein BZA77DRAFT_349866 [Pyronema omphalodes]|nr:hypothetical protein BZA77DRAFT_349866 [Pyronema omphalodes]